MDEVTIRQMAEAIFGDMVKIVVDLKKEIIAVGGDLLADAEALLLKDGSVQNDLWGANIYPDRAADERVEYTSMINIRPKLGNRATEIMLPEIKQQVLAVIKKRLVLY